uniref:Uncharacterized protein n=1 Tax=Mycena chlorophos TaxID=658473 RepID=A0ABQ0L6U5_MYCCL|nr:predicted protein [Mycena chlorophos]
MSSIPDIITSWHEKLEALEDNVKVGRTAAKAQLAEYEVHQVLDGKLFKVVQRLGEDTMQEAIFTIVGVLTQKRFPPLKWHDVQSIDPGRLGQRLTLAGHDTEQFKSTIALIDGFEDMFREAAKELKLQPIDPVTIDDAVGEVMSFDARYFTRGNIPKAARVAFGLDVDPAGVLSSFVGEQYAHCADNVVHYLQLDEDRIVPKAPSSFRENDTVQVGFTLTAFSSKSSNNGCQLIMKPVLRTVVHVDSTLSRSSGATWTMKEGRKERLKARKENTERCQALLAQVSNPLLQRFGSTHVSRSSPKKVKPNGKGPAQPAQGPAQGSSGPVEMVVEHHR